MKKRTPAHNRLLEVVGQLVMDLHHAGFRSEHEPVDGADLVDMMGEWYRTLKAELRLQNADNTQEV